MPLNLVQSNYLEAIGVANAADLSQFENFAQLGMLKDWCELLLIVLSRLHAITAPWLPLIPLSDASLTVNYTRAEKAKDWFLGLWQDEFLADKAKSVRENTKFVKFLLVADPVLSV